MLLRHLETENFLSHHSEEIAFPAEGIFLLQGASGAGKSSFIVDAIAYALFGAVATRARRQADLRHKDYDSEGMGVKATFDMKDGSRLTIARGVDKKGASWAEAYQQEEGEAKLLAQGSAPVGQLVRSYIGGMTWQQFYAAFVARQSEIAMLTSLRGSERKNLVQRMLGMRELEKAGDLLSATLRRLSAEIRQLEVSVGEVDLLAEERLLAQEEEQVKRERERLSGLSKSFKKAEADQKEAAKDLAPLKRQAELAARASAGQQKKLAAQQRLKDLRKKQKEQEEAEKAKQRLPELRARQEAEEQKREDLRELFRRSKDYRESLQVLEKKNGEMQKFRDRAPDILFRDSDLLTLADAVAQFEAQEKEAGRLEQERDDLMGQIKKLQDSGECFVCQRPFASKHDHKQILQDLEKRQETLLKSAEEAKMKSAAFKEGQDLLRQADETRAEITVSKKQIQQLLASGIEEDLKALEKRGGQAKRSCQLLQKEVASLEEAARKTHPGLREEILKAERDAAEKQAPATPPDPDRLLKAEENYAKKKSEADSLRGQIPEAKRSLEEAEKRYEVHKKSLQGRQGELRSLQNLRKQLGQAETVQTMLRAYSQHLSHEIRPALEDIGSEMLRRVSGGKHSGMKIDDDYEISLEDQGGNLLQAGMISGGEAIRASLCLRLALTRLVSQRTGVPVGFLVLDEPLPSQDEGHVERILELLESLRTFYPQQFIISHVGELASADQVDYVLDFPDQGNISLYAA